MNIASRFIWAVSIIIGSKFSGLVEFDCGNINCTECSTPSINCAHGHLTQVPMVSPFVIHLNLSHNAIIELKQKSFVHLPLLINLDLGNNKIQKIPDRVFAGLGSLKKLYLNHNEINEIEIYGFRNLHELEELYLAFNPLISHLDGNIFKELFNLNYLSIFPLKKNINFDSRFQNDLDVICQCNSTIQNQIEPLAFCSRLQNNAGCRSEDFEYVFNRSLKNHSKIRESNEKKKIIKRPKFFNISNIERKNQKERINQHRPKFTNYNKHLGNNITYRSSPILTLVPESIYRIKIGSTIKLKCEADGNPKPGIKWIRHGRTISFNSSLTIERISSKDEGLYECVARNKYGKAVKEVKIIIIGTISLNSNLNTHRVLLEKIIHSIENNQSVEIEDLITTNVLKFVDLSRLLISYSDNNTYFQAVNLMDTNHTLTPVQATVMNNYTGCTGGSRFETFNCEHEDEYSLYYSITGVCNNKKNPTWGASIEPFLRLLPSNYEDGLVKPIGWFDNDWLREKNVVSPRKPNPRKITQELLSTKEISNDPLHNHLLMQFGQFLDHDLSFAALSDNRNLLEHDITDCERTCQNVEPCYSIPFTDEKIGRFNCIEFKRSSEYCGTGYTSVVFGRLIRREQVNMITSYIDGSQIYGNTVELSNYLRNPNLQNNGLMNAIIVDNKTYLPFNNNQQLLSMDCQPEPEFYQECFLAGDHRANEQLGLLVFHNLWLRNHNHLAEKLKILKPYWLGNKIFQEARKIVAAQLQIITYRDWLPLVIGSKGMKMLGDYKGYNNSVNPTIANAFATAAMRFGHTLINKNLIKKLYDPTKSETKSNSSFDKEYRLHRLFFKPELLLQKNVSDSILLGLLMTPLKNTIPEQAITDELTERLFKLSRYTPLDLASINIQRGRDHALPNYNEWRKFCGLKKAKTFDELKYEIKNKNIRNKLAKLYNHPNNIDLYVGGLMEDSDEDAKLGPTFRCLIVDQFKRLRDGDRFFYQNKGVFTKEQLKELNKTSLSKLICINGDNIKNIVENSFLLPKHQSWIDCKTIEDIDLSKWN